MSLSGSSVPKAEKKAFDALYYEDGILSVAAASNNGTRQWVFPASYDSVISVAAIDINNVVADFSNQNEWVELAAPGVGVLSIVPYIPDSGCPTRLWGGCAAVERQPEMDQRPNPQGDGRDGEGPRRTRAGCPLWLRAGAGP